MELYMQLAISLHAWLYSAAAAAGSRTHTAASRKTVSHVHRMM